MKRFGRWRGRMDPPVKPEGDAAVWGGAVPYAGGHGARQGWTPNSLIAGLDPAIQGGRHRARGSWMPGSEPGHEEERARCDQA
jgi:hypothetical protein